LPPERNDIVREIDRIWRTKEFNPAANFRGGNPWLSGSAIRE
jgi:hypothetical protein